MSTLFEELPLELTPFYRTSAVNGSVELYRGDTILHQDGRSWRGRGSVSLNWLPRPHLELRHALGSQGAGLKFEAAEVELVTLGVRTTVRLSTIPFLLVSPGDGVVKAVVGSVDSGSSGPYRRIRFHLPNFHHYLGRAIRMGQGGARLARLAMESEEWSITL